MEAGTLAVWEVESSEAPGHMWFTVTYAMPRVMAFTATESHMLLVIYSYKQIMQNQNVNLGGHPDLEPRTLLRRSMFHLMGFWSKIQRLLVCCLWYVTALVTPKPVTVQLQESFELCWFRMETGSHLSLWQCEDPQGEMLFLFWNGRMKANTPWARDAHAGLHFSGCFCQWISSMWLTTFSPWGPVPLDLSLTDEISFGSLPRLVWKIDVLIVPDQKYFPTFPFLFWPLLLAKSWSVSGSKLKFSITGIKNQKLSGKVFRAGWRIS